MLHNEFQYDKNDFNDFKITFKYFIIYRKYSKTIIRIDQTIKTIENFQNGRRNNEFKL